MGITMVLSLLSGVALFLYGMALMGDSLKKVAGNKLELILYKLTNSPIKGLLLGTVVTAIIQSSSATTVMVVGFVNSGMMKVAQAIGIIMGANIGTSITGWILCLSYIDGSSGIAQLLSTELRSEAIAVGSHMAAHGKTLGTAQHLCYCGQIGIRLRRHSHAIHPPHRRCRHRSLRRHRPARSLHCARRRAAGQSRYAPLRRRSYRA